MQSVYLLPLHMDCLKRHGAAKVYSNGRTDGCYNGLHRHLFLGKVIISPAVSVSVVLLSVSATSVIICPVAPRSTCHHPGLHSGSGLCHYREVRPTGEPHGLVPGLLREASQLHL